MDVHLVEFIENYFHCSITNSMPFLIKRLPHSNKYRVSNKKDGKIHSYATSLMNARRQVRLIGAIDHGF